MRAVVIFALCAAATAAPITPPDTSLKTFPVAYYGASHDRSDENMEKLSKISIVILLQKDGPCWLKCCPGADYRFHESAMTMTATITELNITELGTNQCGDDPPHSYHDASKLPGCNPSCDQHGWQDLTFKRLKALAKHDGRQGPHCMLYVNSIYDAPFNKVSALGDSIHVLDVHGKPHMENADSGFYPFYFLDFGKKAAQKAFLSIVERTVVKGHSDGLYVDNAPIRGMGDCHGNKCRAKRNGKQISVNEEVTPEQVAAYEEGKAKTMNASRDMVGEHGTWFGNNLGHYAVENPEFGENLMFVPAFKPAGGPFDVKEMIERVRIGLQNFKYLIIGNENSFSDPRAETSALPPSSQACSETQIASFLLAVEPGVFLLCNGWDDKFGLHLGLPKSEAKYDEKTRTWSRKFAGGTSVKWSKGVGEVHWKGSAGLIARHHVHT